MFSLEQKNDTMFEIINDMIKKISILEMTVRQTLYNTATTSQSFSSASPPEFHTFTENFPKSQPFLNINNMKMKDVILEEVDEMDEEDELYDDLSDVECYEKDDAITVTMTPMKTESIWNVEPIKTDKSNGECHDNTVLDKSFCFTEPVVKYDIYDVSKPYNNDDVYDDYTDEDADDYSDEDIDDYNVPYTDGEIVEHDNDVIEYANGEFETDDDEEEYEIEYDEEDEPYDTHNGAENVDNEYDYIKGNDNELEQQIMENEPLEMNDSGLNVLAPILTAEIQIETNPVLPSVVEPIAVTVETDTVPVILNIADEPEQEPEIPATAMDISDIQIAGGNLFPTEIQIDNSISSIYISTDESANEIETKENDGTLESINIKRKLTMQQLRSLVVSKGLVSDVSGLRKNDLIKLLDSSI
jgi:hypothetical protein